MANYDLYTELHLDKDMPPNEMADTLGSRLTDLRNRGFGSDTPEVDQVETARAILGDPYKRDIYEAALYGQQDDVVNIRWLHDLADSQSPAAPGTGLTKAPAASGYPSYEPTYEPASSPAGTASGDVAVDADETRVTPVVPDEDELVGSDRESGLKDDPEADPESDASYSAEPASSPVSPEPVAESPSGQGEAFAGAPVAAPTNSWQQPNQSNQAGFGGPQHAAAPHQSPGQPQQKSTPQLDTSTWGVGDRSRSESKIYLGILAVIAVGMIYPLIVLLTAGPNDVTSGLSVMKATLFTLAHVAAWVSINEIIWGVRKVVAPNESTEK